MNNVNSTGQMIMDEYIRVPQKYYSSKYDIKEGDILFNHTNSAEMVGKSFVFKGYNEPITFSNHFSRIRVDKSIVNPNFIVLYLVYLFNQRFFEKFCDRWIHQAAFQKEKLLKLQVYFPNLIEQNRIVNTIEAKLKSVERAKRATKAQQSSSELLFLSYLQKSILNKKWNYIRLGEICEFLGGSQPPKSTFVYSPQKNHIRLVQIQDFRKNDVAVYIPRETARKTFKKDDVMVGRYGPPVFQILRGLEGAYNVALMKAQPKDENILAKNFLFYLLQESNLQTAVINQSQRSAGQSGVDKEFLEKQFVYMPDIKNQKTIAESIDEYKIKVSALGNLLKERSSYIDALRYSVLRQAFRGEL
jgi:restriction endonuclease S subunit